MVHNFALECISLYLSMFHLNLTRFVLFDCSPTARLNPVDCTLTALYRVTCSLHIVSYVFVARTYTCFCDFDACASIFHVHFLIAQQTGDTAFGLTIFIHRVSVCNASLGWETKKPC